MPLNKSEDSIIRIQGFKGIAFGDTHFGDKEVEGYEYRPIKMEECDQRVLTLDGGVSVSDNFNGLSKKQLIQACKERGIKRYGGLEKDDLKARFIG
jgi:hypothetical protein